MSNDSYGKNFRRPRILRPRLPTTSRSFFVYAMTTEMIPTMMLQAFVPAPDELYSIERPPI